VGGTGDIWTSADAGVTWTNQTAGTSAAEQASDLLTRLSIRIDRIVHE
jgi:hypothetical protein